MKTTTKLMGMFLMLSVFNMNATNYFVKWGGSTSADGKTWANAVTLARATTLSVKDNSDVIYVAAGDYDVSSSTQWYNVSLSKGGVTVIGGFAGTEDEASITTAMSNPAVNITRFYAINQTANKIFSAGSTASTQTITVKNINFEDIATQALSTISSVVFGFGSNTTPVVLDGCNFRRLTLNGTASNAATVMSYAGVANNLTIQNCTFENITSVYTTGGVFRFNITATPNTTVEFKNCSAKNISLTGAAGTGAFVSTYHTVVTNTGDKGYYKITDCLFDNCTALGAGAVVNAGQRQSWVISGSVFKNCTAGSYGGAMHIGGAASPSGDILTITNSCFVSNTSVATKAAVTYGTSTGCAVTISRSIITNNSNTGTGVRDIQDPTSTVTYGASESLLNGGFVSSADNTYRGSTNYSNYLTTEQLQTITTASTLNDAIVAGQKLIDDAKKTTQDIQTINYNNLQFSLIGKTLELNSVVNEIDVFSISGSLVRKVSNTKSISLDGLSNGIYLVKSIDSDSNNCIAKVSI